MALRKVEPKHYLAGAAVSNGITWALSFFLLALGKAISSHVFIVTHISICSFSGAIAGYLTARRSSEEHIKIGFTTGLVSSLIYTAVTWIVFGSFDINIWTWIGLLFGGILGGAIRRIKVEKMVL